MSNPLSTVMHYAQEHPVPVAVGVVAVGLVFLYLTGFGKGGNAGVAQANAAADSAYFNAQSAEAQSNNAVSIAQIQANATTAQVKAAADVTNNQTAASVAMAHDNNVTILQLAPYQAQASEVASLSNIAANAQPITTTSTKGGGGFSLGFKGFGLNLGNKTKTTQQVVDNPNAVMAFQLLNHILPANSAGMG